ncbi:hypothetical protein BDV36DRAFT_296375 [Aspergillus pseudocaelatus]|uniref:NmrA-like domain-containing protein n=1 Tax=Aspergillus pseudocaelatus TaxID=1825620 RepID=A0ABQ6WJH4_9EURO|nr:hypothetical protein BDV36DRAFT_296375 [Aspergillus pseudocaelatus]
MKAAITNPAAIWSSPSVYGMVLESPTAGLWLPRRYFEKVPEDAPKNTIILTNGAAEAWKELGTPILDYAPLRCGFLTGQVTRREDIPKSDIRHMFGRFQPAVFPNNLELVDKLEVFARRRVVTPTQLGV